MQSILVAHITADGFDQFIVSKPVVFFQHKASNDEIDRCIWPRSIVVAIKNSKAFFIDSREHNISKIFTPGIHDYLLRSWRKIYKTIIQSDLLILVCFKGHILLNSQSVTGHSAVSEKGFITTKWRLAQTFLRKKCCISQISMQDT